MYSRILPRIHFLPSKKRAQRMFLTYKLLNISFSRQNLQVTINVDKCRSLIERHKKNESPLFVNSMHFKNHKFFICKYGALNHCRLRGNVHAIMVCGTPQEYTACTVCSRCKPPLNTNLMANSCKHISSFSYTLRGKRVREGILKFTDHHTVRWAALDN